jgi:hypothetical protein
MNPIKSATAEALPEYEIIDEFDEMLEIDEIDSESAGATSEITQWLREFRLN